jgi:tetratricopeptide (TPR) repeat protein
MRYLLPILTVLPSLLPSLLTAASLDEALALKKDQRLPEAEAAFTAILVAEPENLRALGERATVRGWQKRYPEAIADWKAVLAREPNHVDAHVGLARVLFWSGQRQAALAELDRALLLSPRDVSIWELKGDIARADGNRTLALTAYREADRLDPQDRVSDRLGRMEGPPTSWRVDVGGISDRYTALRSNEASGYANLGYAHRPERDGGPTWTAGGGVVVERRFDATDVGLQAEGTAKVTDRLRIGARGGYTPGADFMPCLLYTSPSPRDH